MPHFIDGTQLGSLGLGGGHCCMPVCSLAAAFRTRDTSWRSLWGLYLSSTMILALTMNNGILVNASCLQITYISGRGILQSLALFCSKVLLLCFPWSTLWKLSINKCFVTWFTAVCSFFFPFYDNVLGACWMVASWCKLKVRGGKANHFWAKGETFDAQQCVVDLQNKACVWTYKHII